MAGGIFASRVSLVLVRVYRDLPLVGRSVSWPRLQRRWGGLPGDFITVFVFWEARVASIAIIWSSRSPGSSAAGYRYILYHVFGGACLLAGIVYTLSASGSAAIGPVADGPGLVFMLIGIGMNAAFIPIHTWLPDAYPKASVVGSVALSIFTTKAAVFLLADG